MDHREQMQKEADQWQEKSVKLIRGIRYGVLILGILVVLVVFLRNLGFPREVNKTLPALVITEDGQTMECTVEIRGEITHYPLNDGKVGVDDKLTIYANGKYLLQVNYKMATDTGPLFFWTGNHETVAIMSLQKDILLLETNIKNIFPEIEIQRCLLATEATDIQAVWEAAQSHLTDGDFFDLFTFFRN